MAGPRPIDKGEAVGWALVGVLALFAAVHTIVVGTVVYRTVSWLTRRRER